MVGIRTFVDEGLGHSSYLVDLGDGTAAIVDPPRFPTAHLAAAEAQGTALRWTIDTHDSIAGALDGGTDAWRAAGGLIAGIPLVTPSEMVATVIDVRQRSEYEAGHVPGSISIELGGLAERPVPDGPVTVMCGHGERAMTGASILTRRGHRDVTVLDGGPDTWAVSNGRPLVVGA